MHVFECMRSREKIPLNVQEETAIFMCMRLKNPYVSQAICANLMSHQSSNYGKVVAHTGSSKDQGRKRFAKSGKLGILPIQEPVT
ncbi:hypothetical protein CEXT_82001 [Caerostris extrusa]|uniref:Uncharacterized protein n=1 Tax=Caerostris extrusa TaxID=172846 RepID=A0AAV4Q5Y2_CAEEX|nr:hypothetical protein CEXT_82001 [Caerostris extrusa]